MMSREIIQLSRIDIALVVTQLFRLLFGGYLIAFDQFYYNDLESASTVLGIYLIIGVLTSMFLIGKRKWSLIGLIILSLILMIMESIYLGVYISATVPDPTWHDPFLNLWSLPLHYLFPLFTIVFGFKAYKNRRSDESV